MALSSAGKVSGLALQRVVPARGKLGGQAAEQWRLLRRYFGRLAMHGVIQHPQRATEVFDQTLQTQTNTKNRQLTFQGQADGARGWNSWGDPGPGESTTMSGFS